MLFTRSKIRITLAIALLVPLFFYWVINSESHVNEAVNQQITHGVDYFMKQASTKKFNIKGELERTLSTTELNHFPQDKHSTLADPRINLMSDKRLSLTVRSQYGIAFDEEDRLDLDEQVVVTHNPLSDDVSVLNTSTLTLHESQGIAKTESPVEITQQKNITTATGMIINYKTNTSDLLSDVKGTFYVK
ncbi:LPS export ABC transporter periplasmic protein LptC [Neptunomonas antarctica]|uniref:LPS export ABC transporter protein LptC n=1 Tax=Neptunomonas antarctica TaxID=619304 RepID=A0A1N7NX87_9GAMM|nr:LPS export ABC transporter periplasmic protein LptC [Neptunomonas antarctica]SIT02932.1 LPS export ABC transporter protein LptC [Neptunomonas antarctica]